MLAGPSDQTGMLAGPTTRLACQCTCPTDCVKDGVDDGGIRAVIEVVPPVLEVAVGGERDAEEDGDRHEQKQRGFFFNISEHADGERRGPASI